MTVILIWRMCQDRQINLRHYRSIYTTSMGFSPHRTDIRQFKIPPTAFSEQTAKYNIGKGVLYIVEALQNISSLKI